MKQTFLADIINGVQKVEREDIDYLFFEDINDLIDELDSCYDSFYFEMTGDQIEKINEMYGIK